MSKCLIGIHHPNDSDNLGGLYDNYPACSLYLTSSLSLARIGRGIDGGICGRIGGGVGRDVGGWVVAATDRVIDHIDDLFRQAV